MISFSNEATLNINCYFIHLDRHHTIWEQRKINVHPTDKIIFKDKNIINLISRFILIPMLGSIVLSGGGSLNNHQFEIAKLKEARQKWVSSEISNYRFTLLRECWCYWGDVEIEVLDNEKQSRIDAKSRESVKTYGDTIDDLFAIILKEMQSNLRNKPDVIYSTEYDSTFGYPLIIEIDYVHRMADNDITYTINNFEIIEVRPTSH